jgi:hypothetical protein
MAVLPGERVNQPAGWERFSVLVVVTVIREHWRTCLNFVGKNLTPKENV